MNEYRGAYPVPGKDYFPDRPLKLRPRVNLFVGEEQEPDIGRILTVHGFRVNNPRWQVRRNVRALKPELIVADDVAQIPELKDRFDSVPILVLASQDSAAAALEQGAEALRIENISAIPPYLKGMYDRRNISYGVDLNGYKEIEGGLRVNPDLQSVLRADGRQVSLSAREFQLFALLTGEKRLFRSSEIVANIYQDFASKSNVRVLVSRLRGNIGDDIVKTFRSGRAGLFGYGPYFTPEQQSGYSK